MSDGVIKSQSSFIQQIHFEGVDFKTKGNAITPTDIDACLEFRNKLFVLVEVKAWGQSIPDGQRMALERICKAIDGQAGKLCVAFKCWHSTPKPSPIILKTLAVQSHYSRFGNPKYKWKDAQGSKMLVDCVNRLLDYVGISEDDVARCEVQPLHKHKDAR